MKDLTDRQLELAELVAQGYGNAEIADLLRLSPNTVRYHLKQIYARLGVSSRVALARYVLLAEVGRELPPTAETGKRRRLAG